MALPMLQHIASVSSSCNNWGSNPFMRVYSTLVWVYNPPNTMWLAVPGDNPCCLSRVATPSSRFTTMHPRNQPTNDIIYVACAHA